MRNHRGQALLELAIFGMIAMAALGLLVRIGLQANFDQEVRMGAFRRALAAAAADDARSPMGTTQDAMSVSYYYMLDRQMPNPSEGFVGLSRNRTHASAFVERGPWLTFAYEEPDSPTADRDAGRRTHPRVIVRLNETEESYRDNDLPCDNSAGVPCHDEGDDVVIANESVVREQWIINEHNGTVQQQETSSTAWPGTSTRSGAVINLRTTSGVRTETNADGVREHPACGEGVICSNLGAPSGVTWAHSH